MQIPIFQHSARSLLLFPGNIAWNNTPSQYFQFPFYPLDIWAASRDVPQVHLWPLGTSIIKAVSTQIWLIFQCLLIHPGLSSRLGKVSYQASVRMELSSHTAGTETAPNQDIYRPKYDITNKIQNQNQEPQGVNPLPDVQSTQGKVLTRPKKQGPMLGAQEPVTARRLQRHHCNSHTGRASQVGLPRSQFNKIHLQPDILS